MKQTKEVIVCDICKKEECEKKDKCVICKQDVCRNCVMPIGITPRGYGAEFEIKNMTWRLCTIKCVKKIEKVICSAIVKATK